MSTLAITLSDILAAQARILAGVHHTPILRCQTLSSLCGCTLWAKPNICSAGRSSCGAR